MTLYDWLNFLIRLAHLVAGIMWIGTSFYFIWLDKALATPTPARPGVEGELWMVHSGGFYQVVRRRIGPGGMPPVLHWFIWEATATWITGILLLTVVYYMTGGVYLVNGGAGSLSNRAAIAIGAGSIWASWWAYDALWQSPLGRRGWPATVLSLALLAAITFGFCRVFSGRGAFIHVGAILGTLMVSNVWRRIIPAQRQMIAATERGEEPDLRLSAEAKRRSVHNSYMTFPVLFIMLSNHFPGAWGHPLNWLVLILLMVAGACARHVMIGSGASRYAAGAALAASLIAAVVITAPRTPGAAAAGGAGAGSAVAGGVAGGPVAFARVRAIVTARCVVCHSAHPVDPTFGAAPAGVSFDEDATIAKLAERIQVRAVITKTMPLANKTGITDDERAVLGRWIEQGAHLDR